MLLVRIFLLSGYRWDGPQLSFSWEILQERLRSRPTAAFHPALGERFTLHMALISITNMWRPASESPTFSMPLQRGQSARSQLPDTGMTQLWMVCILTITSMFSPERELTVALSCFWSHSPSHESTRVLSIVPSLYNYWDMSYFSNWAYATKISLNYLARTLMTNMSCLLRSI